MKFIQIASRVMNGLRGGFQVDDNKIDWELVYDEIHKQRSVVMYQDWLRNKKIDDSFYQLVRCLKGQCRPIKCKDKFGEWVDSGDQEWYVEVPKVMAWQGEPLVKYFGTNDLQIPFNRKDPLARLYSSSDIYGGRQPIYTPIGDEWIVENPPTCGLQFLGLVAVLDNPLATKCSNEALEEEYPMPQRLIPLVEQNCIQLISQMLNIDPEQPNDARDQVIAGQTNNRRR